MTVDLFLQLLVNGISIGLLYALVALGLVLVLGVANVFNFAHGDFYMLGAFALYGLYALLKVPFLISVLLSALIVALLGAICDQLVFQHVRGSLLKAAAATIGLGIIARQAALQSFGTAGKGVNPFIPGTARLGNVILAADRLALVVLCLFLIGLLALFLTRTKLGMAMRATTLNETAAQLQGIDTSKMYLVATATGFGLAGAAGAVTAPVLMVQSEMGHQMLFLVLMVVMLGGMQSALGAFVGGLLIGITSSFGFNFFGGLSEVFVFLICGIVLLFRPWGIFGRPIEI
ncbi:MAG: branched-chain amino acid ABC transporter permease [Chloroflexi bacterium]|nr:branched-chain amino acid ABC transporter permease [Chloroflexota bacterium]